MPHWRLLVNFKGKANAAYTIVSGHYNCTRMIRQMVVILVVSLLPSCGFKVDEVEREKLPGRYVFTHWSKDTIEIRADGTYNHFTFINGKKLENQGVWTLRASQDEIQFKEFSFLTDNLPPGNWFSRLRVEGEEIHLMYACDINAYYKKVSELDSVDINDR